MKTYPLDTGCKLNVYKTFNLTYIRLIYATCQGCKKRVWKRTFPLQYFSGFLIYTEFYKHYAWVISFLIELHTYSLQIYLKRDSGRAMPAAENACTTPYS